MDIFTNINITDKKADTKRMRWLYISSYFFIMRFTNLILGCLIFLVDAQGANIFKTYQIWFRPLLIYKYSPGLLSYFFVHTVGMEIPLPNVVKIWDISRLSVIKDSSKVNGDKAYLFIKGELKLVNLSQLQKLSAWLIKRISSF